jgi:hypothetical protein
MAKTVLAFKSGSFVCKLASTLVELIIEGRTSTNFQEKIKIPGC